MTVSTVAHVNFAGNAREALEFYHAVFGGHLVINTYGDGGVPRDSPDGDRAEFVPVPADSPDADHVAFGLVAAENGFRLAAYDVFGAGSGGGVAGAGPGAGTGVRRADALTHTESFFLLLNGETVAEITALWEGLAAGGTVIQALAPTAWSPAYGMLTDRFGVTWAFGIAPS